MTKNLKLLLVFLMLIFVACNNNSTNKSEKFSWTGVWEFTEKEQLTKFTLTIDEKVNEGYNCKIETIGLETYYLIQCTGKETETGFEIYYSSTLDGGFYQAEYLEKEKPLLILVNQEDVIISNWVQLVGGINGEVSFEKKAKM
jgi:hypothetical protein